MEIRIDSEICDPRIIRFLEEHLEDMRAVSPPESKHALDLDSLRKPEITFLTIWIHEKLAGCGALKELPNLEGEIKSMRTASEMRGRGIAVALVNHIIAEARKRSYTRLSLETGSMPYFAPARALYSKLGFKKCPPFADYKPDLNSAFYQLDLD